MKRNASPISSSEMKSATQRANWKVQAILDRARHISADSQKADRMKAHQCKACFYSPPGIAGAAMTTQACALCGAEQTYGSTHTDVLCQECAEWNALCKHCGGDVEMQEGREVWPAK